MVRMALTRPLSQLTIQSFGDISRFLREGVADEESRQMRDSMVVLAQAVDTAVRSRRARSDAVDITRYAAALVQAVRAHQLFLTGLGSAWHSLYEFGAYQNALRELRRELAQEGQVPPYVIFHDATLREMARFRPSSLAELGNLSGVGAKKLDAYGDAFLQVIRRH